MSLQHSPRIITDGLVLCLDAANKQSYSGSGNVWTDLAGSNNGDLTNGPTFSSENGGSIVFDGTDDFCDLIYNWPSIFTISLWLFPISAPGGDYSRVISTGSNDWFEIAINSSNQISYYFVNIGNWQSNVITLTSNIWTNLVFINNSTNAFIFQNSLLSHTGTGALATAGTSLRIGDRYSGGECANIRLSILQIYNRALSPTEVLQNYNATKGRYNL
jgi:hypothetical protein